MLFIGLDLAWSTKNATGIAILEGNKKSCRLIHVGLVNSNNDIINYINEKTKDKKAFIAIDSPLIVPNEYGRRAAEKLTGTLFRKYDAGAHPANRKRLSQWQGSIRGEDISKLLEKSGFKQDPFIKKFEESRKFFEVYPHPSMVVLFNLNKILQYKAKPKRDYNFRWKEFERYQKCLKNLEKAKPALILPKEIIRKNVKKLKALELKNYEDLLDAIFCAYIAYYSWVNPDKCAILGSMNEGYIFTPVFDFMHEQLKGIKSQKNLIDFQ